MSYATEGLFNNYPVFPKLVTDETLKRARVESDGGVSIKVSPLDPIPSTDITDLKNNVQTIKSNTQAVNTKIGDRDATPWDFGTNTTELIPIEKKTCLNVNTIKTVVGSNEDTASDPSIYGVLKSIDGKTATTDLTPVTSALGATTDQSTDTTVIGLLKSISSKLQ